jgi:RNA polymerase sigma factor (sigma-70 family)
MRPDELPRIAHDPAIFEAFYRAHVEDVQRFVVRRVADPHLAADLTAEVFLAAIDAAPSYQPDRGAPVAWLFGIARNVVSAEHRRAGRERRAQAEVDGRRLLEPDDVARMQDRIDAATRAREIHAALAQLPEGERAVFELIALDDLTPAEAAAVLGIRAVTARVRLHRARSALRQLFDDDPHPLIQPMEAAP